jgi:hypothetical protein
VHVLLLGISKTCKKTSHVQLLFFRKSQGAWIDVLPLLLAVQKDDYTPAMCRGTHQDYKAPYLRIFQSLFSPPLCSSLKTEIGWSDVLLAVLKMECNTHA